MKKHLIAVIIAIAVCLSVLSGCSLMNSLEKDVTVVAKDGAHVLKTGVVNTFNSMIMPTCKADGQSLEDSAEKGYYFAGWATVENWKEGEEGCDESQFFGKEYITYADVKSVVTDGSVVLYPAYKIKINYFFVFGYYSWTSTSGLDEATMQPVAEALEAYLNGKYPAEISAFVESDPEHNKVFDMRGYNPGGNSIGGAGDMVNKDGDVGIFFGGGNNMDSTGKMYCYAKTGTDGSCIHIGGKSSRVAGLLKDDDVSIDVFNWFQNYVKENIDSAFTVEEKTYDQLTQPEVKPEEPEEPETPDTPTVTLPYKFPSFEGKELSIGWWSSSSSGLTEDMVKKVVDGLNASLKASGVDISTLTITFKAYDGTVKVAGAAILADAAPADILLGFGGNLTTSTDGGATGGNLTGLKNENRISGIKMGEKTGRYIDLYDDTNDFAQVVFNWFRTSEAQVLFL